MCVGTGTGRCQGLSRVRLPPPDLAGVGAIPGRRAGPSGTWIPTAAEGRRRWHPGAVAAALPEESTEVRGALPGGARGRGGGRAQPGRQQCLLALGRQSRARVAVRARYSFKPV